MTWSLHTGKRCVVASSGPIEAHSTWQYIPEAVYNLLPSVYTVEKAVSWVKYDRFLAFMTDRLQAATPAKSTTRQKRLRSTSILEIDASDNSSDVFSSPLADKSRSKRIRMDTRACQDMTSEISSSPEASSSKKVNVGSSEYAPSSPSSSLPMPRIAPASPIDIISIFSSSDASPSPRSKRKPGYSRSSRSRK